MALRTSEVDDVRTLINEEKQLHEELKKLEKQIYGLETSYLESTSSAGNLVRGWGEMLSRPPSTNRKKRKIVQEDRIFSLSSATAMKVHLVPGSTDMLQNNEQTEGNPDSLIGRKKKTYEEW